VRKLITDFFKTVEWAKLDYPTLDLRPAPATRSSR